MCMCVYNVMMEIVQCGGVQCNGVHCDGVHCDDLHCDDVHYDDVHVQCDGCTCLNGRSILSV